MKRLRATLICAASGGMLVMASSPADACSCRARPYAEALAATPVVFDGAVVRVVMTEARKQVTTLRVVRPIKGEIGKTVDVVTGTSSPACGYDFRRVEGTVRVGALRGTAGRLTTNSCTMFQLNRTPRR